jgi:hypothetical protein
MGGNLPPTRRAALESCHSTVKRGPVTQTGAESDQATAFQLVLKTAKTAQPCAIWAGERRGWDSNPRMTLTAIAGFQDRRDCLSDLSRVVVTVRVDGSDSVGEGEARELAIRWFLSATGRRRRIVDL